MKDLTQIPQFTIQLFGLNLVFNVETIIMTWIVMASLITLGFLATRKIGFLPNPFQAFAPGPEYQRNDKSEPGRQGELFVV